MANNTRERKPKHSVDIVAVLWSLSCLKITKPTRGIRRIETSRLLYPTPMEFSK